MDRQIRVPITKEDVKSLKAGDYVYLSGTIYSAISGARRASDWLCRTDNSKPDGQVYTEAS